jgi:hypothetical protein
MKRVAHTITLEGYGGQGGLVVTQLTHAWGQPTHSSVPPFIMKVQSMLCNSYVGVLKSICR